MRPADLGAAESSAPPDEVPAAHGLKDRAVRIRIGDDVLEADLHRPGPSRGTVIFAHGSGSGRSSPRNRHVAEVLEASGVGGLLLDLLTPSEEETDLQTTEYRFNIPLLTERLLKATDWLLAQPWGKGRPVGYFGASTGGAVALAAAAEQAAHVSAIVLRGARTDLAAAAVGRVHCPTLILVGENDPTIRAINQETMHHLRSTKRLVVLPGASHLFEEPGTLEFVAVESRKWFDHYLVHPRRV
ncbi:MAG TPA: alpha/beta hydrolase [Thermoplasmata archaeon]|nr:alpha/beta hydrolase [Thermoplasmata archaeon]